MYIKLLAIPLILIAGCATTSKVDPSIEKDIKFLKWRTMYLQYSQDHDRCFIDYNMCKVDNKKDCWKKHEACVIRNSKLYKSLLD